MPSTPATPGLLTLLVLLLPLAGCAAGTPVGGSDPPTPPGSPMTPPPGEDAGPATPPSTPPPTESCPGGGETRLSGVVRFPNGTLPVSGALVYVPHGDPDAVARSGECGECVDAGALAAWTVSAADGTFTLRGVPAGEHTLVVDKGRFRRVSTVSVTACAEVRVPEGQTRLPASSAEGRVPRIAVVQGDYDRMEDVLERLGLDRGEIDLFESPSFRDPSDEAAALLRDMARLAAYDIVFVNCGAGVGESIFGTPLDATQRANVQAFVEGGGRLYVTDLAYDLLESSMPPYVDFADGGSGSSPETPDAAEIGEELTLVDATVEDDALREWLRATGAMTGSTIPVHGLESGWSVIEAVDPEHTTIWVRGEVEWFDERTFDVRRGERPLTVSFERGCGRALFTSYHTSDIDPRADLSPQEQALAFLVLEIGSCIEEPAPELI